MFSPLLFQATHRLTILSCDFHDNRPWYALLKLWLPAPRENPFCLGAFQPDGCHSYIWEKERPAHPETIYAAKTFRATQGYKGTEECSDRTAVYHNRRLGR